MSHVLKLSILISGAITIIVKALVNLISDNNIWFCAALMDLLFLKIHTCVDHPYSTLPITEKGTCWQVF